MTGNPTKTKIIARQTAYHGTSLGALTATGITGLRAPFEPLTPGGCHVPNTNTYRLSHHMQPEDLAETVRDRILFEDPSTVAAVIMEPVQNSGGCFTPPEGYFQRVREICDEFGVLFISDEVICSWGRLGEYFGCERYGYQPDIITTAKGITSAYAPMGAMITSDKVAEPFLEGTASFTHGFTFGGHPIACAVSHANLDVFEREHLLDHVREQEPRLRGMLDSLRDIPIVGDVRGAGFFHAIELVKDQGTKESFSDEEAETLLRGYLSAEMFRRGLICRADDRGDPVIQLSPPLIAGEEEWELMEGVLRPVLEEASRRMHVGGQ
jgi:adenosylmethionine-8-amino-7-oxononanoate aminotransferase